MTDPLTYLDEVDALAATLSEENWAEADGAVVSRVGFICADVPALSKALRAVIELHTPHLNGVTRRAMFCTCCSKTWPCRTRNAIQAALAVNDEGGTR